MKSLKGKKILISAGPTREYIDPVRYLSNDSSGQMGIALAEAAIRLKAHVTLIHGPIALVPPKGVRRLFVTSAQEMLQAVKKNYKSADIIIMAAAVSDFRPAKFSKNKIKKNSRLTTYDLRLIKNPDILKWLGKNRRKDQKLVGFALETKDLIKNAQKKLTNKKCDVIIANYSSSIGKDKSAVKILTRKGVQKTIAKRSKRDIARAILNQVSELL